MASILRFEEIISWKEARILNGTIGKLIDDNRLDRNYRLISQIEGSSGSIMDNIAEGFGRGSRKEFVNCLSIAKGSAEESRSQLYRCLDNGLTDEKLFVSLINQLDILVRKTGSLIHYLNSVSTKGQKFKDRF